MAKETVNHPAHYQACAEEARPIVNRLGVVSSFLSKECIEAIEVFDLNFHLGNTVKYLWRCGNKGDRATDLKKALWYLERHREKYPAATYNRDSEAISMIKLLLEKELSANGGN